MFIAYAARGIAAYEVRLALDFFALSLRVRRRSARISGPASPVETCHPQVADMNLSYAWMLK